MRKKKPIEEIDSPPERELYLKMMQMPEPYKSYAAFTYLYGNRVSEPLGRKETFVVNGKTVDVWAYKPVYKTSFEEKDRFLIVHNIATLKRKTKKKPVREAYVDMDGPGEAPFVKILLDYLDTKEEYEPLWTHSRKTQWKYSDKFLGIPPHKLRGMRATKDAVTYHLDAIDLKRKFNWATEAMAMHYAAKDPRDIMQKMRRNKA